MEAIPAIYWMIVIGVIAIMICVVLLFIALFINDSRGVIHKSISLMDDTSKSLKLLENILTNLQGTMNELSTAILVPIRRIQNAVSMVTGFLDGITGKKRDSEE
jgi:predicted PurR-regulated permease PerM